MEGINEIHSFLEQFEKRKNYFFGYPSNFENNFSDVGQIFSYLFNNIGDPYEERHLSTNTKKFEREIISFYAKMYKMAPNSEWGYITNGSTESILQALFLAREKYNSIKLFYSEEAHYCVKKNAYILNISSQVITVNKYRQIDIQDLKQKILDNKDITPVIVLNIGNTFNGAVDNCKKVVEMIKSIGCSQYYIHLDAAMAGHLIPFVSEYHDINFTLPIDSISISGHKFLGLPNPSGLFLTKKTNINSMDTEFVSYIDSNDITISGSRSGSNVLLWWLVLQNYPVTKLNKIVQNCLKNTKYAANSLQSLDIPIKGKNLNTIVIDAPKKDLMLKWHLPFYNGLTHLVIMPHINKSSIDKFIQELFLDRI